MKDTLTSLEDAFMRQALERISGLIEESDRLKERANEAWVSASKVVLEHRGLSVGDDARIVVDKESDGLVMYLLGPDPEEQEEETRCKVVKGEPVLVE